MQQRINKETKKPVFMLDLTARGFCEQGIEEWFDISHDWIVNGFVDLTGPEIQKSFWKRVI
jgi:hypothetical protein